MDHRGVGAGGVAGEDRAHHGVVLAVGAHQAAVHPELGAAEGADAAAQAHRIFRQRRIVRAGIDRRMEGDVGVGIGLGLAGFRQRDHRFVACLQTPPFDRRHAHGGEAGAGRFHLGHRHEQALDLLGCSLGNDGALARPHVDQAAHCELAQRLPNRRAGHAMQFGEAHLVEPFAGRQRAVQDSVGDGSGELVGQGRVGVGAHAGLHTRWMPKRNLHSTMPKNNARR